MMTGGWSDIPYDFILEINKRLDFVDIIRSDVVCTSWRSVPIKEKISGKCEIPWLMLSSSKINKIDKRYFYGLGEHKIYQFDLPEMADRYCIGSSNGSLLSIDRNGNIMATNPLARGGTHLQIPPTPIPPMFSNVVRQLTEEEIRNNYFVKAILSPTLDAVIAIRLPYRELYFAQIGGGQSWTLLCMPHVGEAKDMLFHNGLLHVIDYVGTIVIFDLRLPSVEPLFVFPGPSITKSADPSRYLVESPCKEDLFLVCRIRDSCRWVTNNFKVFLLDKETYLWKRIYTLGDISFFLGFNYSVAFPALDFPYIEKNCIYFTNDYKIDFDPPEFGSDKWFAKWGWGLEDPNDEGVFCLEDSSVWPILDDDNLNKPNWLPSTWFMPIPQ